MYDKKTCQFSKLEEHQRVLGVIQTDYAEATWISENSFRLFLYSDGAFEVFDTGGKMLGEQKLLEWISSTVDLPASEQLQFLKDKIIQSSSILEEMDDLSLVILDVNLQ